MRIRVTGFVVAVAVVLAGGCGQDKKPSPKEEATRQWNAARAAVMLSLAQDQFRSGNFDKSRQTVSDALKLVPESASLRVLSAKIFIEQGQLEAAEQELKLARQNSPNDGEAYYLSGVVYQRWQKTQDAFDFYKAAAGKSPADLAYLLAEAEMLVAMDRTPEALVLLAERVNYFEHSGTIRDAVGQLLVQLKRYDEAVAMLRQASILSGDDATIRERLALALYYHGDWRECIDVLTLLLQKEPFDKRGDLFTVLAECQLQAGRPRDARYSFETASQLDAYSAPIWRGLGQAALEIGDLKRAELALNKAVKLDASAPETHLLLGYACLRQGRLPEALVSFQLASRIDPHDTVSLCMIGYTLGKTGRHRAAVECFAKALVLKPGDDMATQLMAGADLHD